MHYFPISAFYLALLSFLVLLLFFLVEIGVLKYAYQRLGVGRWTVYLLLLLSLAGSYINIPVFRLPPEQVVSGQTISFYGVTYVIPLVENWSGTVIAVNLGGAVVPTLLSLYLLIKQRLFWQGPAAIAIVTLCVHLMAYPVRGVGIAEPTFIPPLIATAVALLLSWRSAPALAYISGSLGTLIGADLLNLGKIHGLGAPVASIGGAGTFDGIFLTGILALLLASLLQGRSRPDRPPTTASRPPRRVPGARQSRERPTQYPSSQAERARSLGSAGSGPPGAPQRASGPGRRAPRPAPAARPLRPWIAQIPLGRSAARRSPGRNSGR
jgi:uncharacterized membrane protein